MSLKIIGAGLGRTGTASLKIALDTLGLGPCYHMSEVLGNAGHIDRWLDVASGKPDWPAIFGTYQSTVDFPASNYWRELAEFYPEAKVVLSHRDAERWFASTQKTIFSERLQQVTRGTKWAEMLTKTMQEPFSPSLNDRETVLAAYEAHNEAVKAALGPERLLVYEVKQGWAPLCEFLGVPVPAEGFPNVNSSQEFDGVFELLESPIGQQVMAGKGMGGESVHDEVWKPD